MKAKVIRQITDIFTNPEKALKKFLIGIQGIISIKIRETKTGYVIYFREGDELPPKTKSKDAATINQLWQNIKDKSDITFHVETLEAKVDGLEWAAIYLNLYSDT